jgi:hypothetical protein
VRGQSGTPPRPGSETQASGQVLWLPECDLFFKNKGIGQSPHSEDYYDSAHCLKQVLHATTVTQCNATQRIPEHMVTPDAPTVYMGESDSHGRQGLALANSWLRWLGDISPRPTRNLAAARVAATRMRRLPSAKPNHSLNSDRKPT